MESQVVDSMAGHHGIAEQEGHDMAMYTDDGSDTGEDSMAVERNTMTSIRISEMNCAEEAITAHAGDEEYADLLEAHDSDKAGTCNTDNPTMTPEDDRRLRTTPQPALQLIVVNRRHKNVLYPRF